MTGLYSSYPWRNGGKIGTIYHAIILLKIKIEFIVILLLHWYVLYMNWIITVYYLY